MVPDSDDDDAIGKVLANEILCLSSACEIYSVSFILVFPGIIADAGSVVVVPADVV